MMTAPLAPHPKNIDHKGRVSKLEAAISSLKQESSDWRVAKEKYSEETKRAATAADALKRTKKTSSSSAAAAAGADDSSEDLSSSDDDSGAYEKELLSKLGSFNSLDRLLNKGVPNVFFAVDTMARALNKTGQVIDAAPAAAAKASAFIRGDAFKGYDLIGGPKQQQKGGVAALPLPASTAALVGAGAAGGSSSSAVPSLMDGFLPGKSGLTFTTQRCMRCRSEYCQPSQAILSVGVFFPSVGTSKTPGRGKGAVAASKTAAAAVAAASSSGGGNNDVEEGEELDDDDGQLGGSVLGEDEEEEEGGAAGGAKKKDISRPSVPTTTPMILKKIQQGRKK
jgi:hypothetical protein